MKICKEFPQPKFVLGQIVNVLADAYTKQKDNFVYMIIPEEKLNKPDAYGYCQEIRESFLEEI